MQRSVRPTLIGICSTFDRSPPLVALGKAIAEAGRPLVYGGGSKGIMGAVSGAVLDAGGDVTGVVPYAMVAVGGEVDQTKGHHAPHILLKEKGREKVCLAILRHG